MKLEDFAGTVLLPIAATLALLTAALALTFILCREVQNNREWQLRHPPQTVGIP